MTLEVREGMASLRTVAVVREVEGTFRRMRGRQGFRLAHYSIQGNHLHAIVEATGSDALGRGMKSLGIRFARAVNRALRRSGPICYVLLNARRHAAQGRGSKRLPGPVRLDPASSARGFEGWRWRPPEEETLAASPPVVSRPRSWLLAVGWRLRGLLDPSDVPGRA